MATIKVTRASLDATLRTVDWAKIDAQTDEQIARNVAADPDVAPILDEAETAAGMAKTIRKRLKLSQAEFAARFGIPLGTLRDWEQGRATPDKPALTLLRVIEKQPDMVAEALAPAHAA